MSKTLISVLVVGVLVVGGYFVFRGNKVIDNAQVANNEISGEQEQTTVPSGKKMAFSEFMKQGGSYKCEVNQDVNDVETKGVTYINDGMVRGEYNTKVQGQNINSTLIVRDGFVYSWTSMLPNMGFKAKADTSASGDVTAGASGSYSWNAEQIGDYNCEAWTVDQSKFTVPTNITFKMVGEN